MKLIQTRLNLIECLSTHADELGFSKFVVDNLGQEAQALSNLITHQITSLTALYGEVGEAVPQRLIDLRTYVLSAETLIRNARGEIG